MSKVNPSIGTCPCPTTGCKESCSVKKFAHRATTDRARRNAGKLYIDCPTHGRFGFDGKAGMQDWILEHATIEGQAPPAERSSSAPSSAHSSAASAAPGAPGKPRSAPASAPRAETSAPERSKKGGGFTTLLG